MNAQPRQALTWTQASGPDRVQLAGEITEESDFAPLVQNLPANATLDLSQIRRINSCGVREWLTFVSELKRAGKHVILEPARSRWWRS